MGKGEVSKLPKARSENTNGTVLHPTGLFYTNGDCFLHQRDGFYHRGWFFTTRGWFLPPGSVLIAGQCSHSRAVVS